MSDLGNHVASITHVFICKVGPQRLRGFARVAVRAGETQTVELVVPADDLKLWNSDAHAFTYPAKRAKIRIGASSADIRLKKRIRLSPYSASAD